MFSFRYETIPLRRGKKKADMAEPPQGFDHVGLLFNQPPGTAGLPFNESSELEFSNAAEPISKLTQAPGGGDHIVRSAISKSVFVL